MYRNEDFNKQKHGHQFGHRHGQDQGPGEAHLREHLHEHFGGMRGGPGRPNVFSEMHGGRGRWGGPGGRGGFGGHRGPGNPGGPGGMRERLEKGLLRYIIMDVLSSGPRHGYEIIKQLEERTQGRYAPSPGTLYPTLQYLEDLGLVTSEQADGRRVYSLSEAGAKELKEHHSHAQNFWQRFGGRGPGGAGNHEFRFLWEAYNDLGRTVRGSFQGAGPGGPSVDADTARQIRLVLERAQNEVRGIIAKSSDRPEQGESESGEGSGEEDGEYTASSPDVVSF